MSGVQWTDPSMQKRCNRYAVPLSPQEYTDEIEDISDADKAALKDTFRDLTIETARTPLAANRFMRIVRRSGPVVYETLRGILVDAMAETAVKITTGK